MRLAKLGRYVSALKLERSLGNFRYNFEKRLELQKQVYLLQEAGADLGYHFGWYKHGPYSSSLADDAYPLSAVPADRYSLFQGDVNSKAVQKFNSLLEALPKDKLSYWLELLSCIHYVIKHSYPRAKTRKEATDSIMRLKGDHFSKIDIEKAYDLLENAGFL